MISNFDVSTVSAGTPEGTAVPANSFRFSSEVYDAELDIVYYNYRHSTPPPSAASSPATQSRNKAEETSMHFVRIVLFPRTIQWDCCLCGYQSSAQ